MAETAPITEGGELFTRGGLDMPDNRGATLVAKHAEKVQKEKEERAMSKLGQLLPHLGAATHAIALQECNWEEDRALAMLRMFAVSKAEELRKVQNDRKKQIKKLEEQAKPQISDQSRSSDGSESDRSRSGSESSSGTDSEDNSEDDCKGRKSSHKRSRSTKSDRHSSKKKKHRKEKDSKRRKEKKRKKERKERTDSKRRRRDDDVGKPRTKEPEYGAYGVIRETDYYTKRPEFTLWALEIKKADVETMSRFEEKELFKSFMEDYNTATLPHRKYYNLESYETEERRKGSGSGRAGGERMVFDDESERKKEVLAQRQRDHAERLRAAYEELQTTDKAQAMREQEILRAKMALAYRTGDQKEAARIAERLKPDEPK